MCYFNTTLVKVHLCCCLPPSKCLLYFNTTLVKVHHVCRELAYRFNKISIQPLLRFISTVCSSCFICSYFNTTLVKVHQNEAYLRGAALSDFNTTLVKVHPDSRSAASFSSSDFNTTLVKVHPGKSVNIAQDYIDFNTTLVKVHRIRRGSSIEVLKISIQPLLRFIVNNTG